MLINAMMITRLMPTISPIAIAENDSGSTSSMMAAVVTMELSSVVALGTVVNVSEPVVNSGTHEGWSTASMQQGNEQL